MSLLDGPPPSRRGTADDAGKLGEGDQVHPRAGGVCWATSGLASVSIGSTPALAGSAWMELSSSRYGDGPPPCWRGLLPGLIGNILITGSTPALAGPATGPARS